MVVVVDVEFSEDQYSADFEGFLVTTLQLSVTQSQQILPPDG